jgi:hypothetical protein
MKTFAHELELLSIAIEAATEGDASCGCGSQCTCGPDCQCGTGATCSPACDCAG